MTKYTFENISAYNGFFGCNVFKQINNYLEENKKEIINW